MLNSDAVNLSQIIVSLNEQVKPFAAAMGCKSLNAALGTFKLTSRALNAVKKKQTPIHFIDLTAIIRLMLHNKTKELINI